MKINVNIRKIFYMGLAFFVLVTSAGAYPQAGQITSFYIGTIIFSIASIFYSQKFQINKEAFLSWVFLMTIFIALLALRGEWLYNGMQNRVLLKLIIVLLVIVAWSSISHEEMIRFYIKVFNFLLAVSIPCLILAYVNHNFFSPIAFTGKYSSVNTLYFYNNDVTVRSFLGIHFIKAADITSGIFRNQGIFWEPGVFSFFITWFYVLKNCYLRDQKLNWLYYLVELTTISAAGIMIFMGAVFYVKLLHGKSVARFRSLFLMTSVIIAAFVLLVLNENGIEQILRLWGGIFGRDFYNEASAITRWRDFYYGLMSAMDKIWWGQGWDYSNYNAILRLEANSGKAGEWGGITNSIVAVLYKYGIFFWLFYMWLLWRWSIRIAREGAWVVVLFLVFMATLMHEPLDSSIIIMSFLIYPVPVVATKASGRYS